MEESSLKKIQYKLQDHMLLGSVFDTVMKKTKYRDEKLSFLYNVMVGQKHRMLYYKRLKKEYWEKCTAERPWEQEAKHANPKQIWFCWLQGMKEAPPLVQKCYESLKKNLPDRTITVIDADNVFEYITLPEQIMEKWKKGILKPAHFSDLIRLELLIRYGGYWIDATVYCTDAKLLRYTDEMPIFMYSFYYFGFNPEIMETNNWFLYGTTNQNILCLTRAFLYEYWKEKNRAVDYFIFHLFMTMACEFYEEEYRAMPIVSQVESHILATYMGQPFDALKYRVLTVRCGFHKLSTRFGEKETTGQNTFYQYFMEGKLPEIEKGQEEQYGNNK